jgi:ubiquinone/menaquinone biosynthesis C-methylase UbiE
MIIESLDLKPGVRVADIGSGPGYYAFKFAERVGEHGRIYAIDINERHLQYIAEILQRRNIRNVETVLSKPDDICLSNKVDLAFMCSLYHIIYATDTQASRDRLVASIERALKPGGQLIVADNDIVGAKDLPYHGPQMVKDLVVSQLTHYGFRLSDYHQFTPQRYVLVFRLQEAFAPPVGQ